MKIIFKFKTHSYFFFFLVTRSPSILMHILLTCNFIHHSVPIVNCYLTAFCYSLSIRLFVDILESYCYPLYFRKNSTLKYAGGQGSSFSSATSRSPKRRWILGIGMLPRSTTCTRHQMVLRYGNWLNWIAFSKWYLI